MKHTTYHRHGGLVRTVYLLGGFFILTAFSATAQPSSTQNSTSPNTVAAKKTGTLPQEPPISATPTPGAISAQATPGTPSATPFPPWQGTPPGGNQPGAPYVTPTPPETPTPSPSPMVNRGGQAREAPLGQSGHQHRKFPFLPSPSSPLTQQPPIIQEEATEDYQLFPLAEEEAPPSSVCVSRPGYGLGEQVIFPPTLGYRDVWPLLYLDKDHELSFALPFSEGDWGTGDWFGIRHPMVDHGVNIYGSYGSDIQGSVTGGNSLGFGYADCFDFRLDLDTERLTKGWWKGGHLVFSGLDRNGNNLSQQYIGNTFTVAQIWGDQTINYYGLWLEQSLFDDWWNIKLGRFAVTDDFTANPLIYGLYLNNGINGQPMAAAVDGFLSAYPAAVWAARIRFNDKKHNLYAMAGIYQTTNRLYKPAYHGLDFSIRREDGINFIWEIGWVPEFQPHPAPAGYPSRPSLPPVTPETWHGLLGHYKFGVFYTSWRDIPQFLPRDTFYSYGFYWLFDQMVYQAAPGTDQGLTLWTVFVYSPQQNTAQLPFQATVGAVYTGLIPGRRKDQLALAMIYGTFSNVFATNQRLLGQGYPTYELVLEAGYRINLSTFFYIEPDIQYVIRPGGTGRIPNALVIGAQVGFNF